MPVSDEDLARSLTETLGRAVASLTRRSLPYRSSFAIEVVEVHAHNRETLAIVFKDVGPGALSHEAVAAKPAFMLDPEREVIVYREILDRASLGTPALLGSVLDPTAERYWLFLELVDGEPLWNIAAMEAWEEAARWLARLHARRPVPASAALLHYDASWYEVWLRRACAVAPAALETAARVHPRAVERLTALPSGLLHGEFYASNVLIAGDADEHRVCAVDWETAGIGPGVLDLAALTAGGWAADQRERLALAYHGAWSEAGGGGSMSDLLAALVCARLQVALQWIGWSSDWRPPSEHAQDWLAVAIEAARELEAA